MKITFLLSISLLLFTALPDSASALVVLDKDLTANRVKEVTVDCPLYNKHTSKRDRWRNYGYYWEPWSGTTGKCVVEITETIYRISGIETTKLVCRKWVGLFQKLEYTGDGKCEIYSSAIP